MRLQFPTHISVPRTVAFAAGIVVLEQFQHTVLTFSLLFFTFTVLSVLTFNAAGGFNRPTGSYVFFFALLTVIAAVTLKAFLGEPAQSNLEEPLTTLAVYNVGMALMLGTVLLKNRFIGNPQGLGLILNPGGFNLTFSAAGCMAVGVLVWLTLSFVSVGGGSLLSALNQVNFFMPLGVILANVAAVTDSKGERSVTALSLTGSGIMFFIGMLGFSKQGLFTPLAAWFIGAMYGRLRVRWIHVVVVGALSLFMYGIVTPIAQTGRVLAGDTSTISERVGIFVDMMMNPVQTRAHYQEGLEQADLSEGRHHYYNHTLGLGDRIAMFQFDDGLIAWIDQNQPVGYEPLRVYFSNLIPHALGSTVSSEPEQQYGGNYYAHLIGGYLSPDDFTTGISFGFLGECFAMGRWEGVVILAPLLWFVLFAVTELISGDLRTSPWGLLPMLLFMHVAPESLVSGLVGFLRLVAVGLPIGIWFCVYLGPILGSAVGTALVRRQRVRGLGYAALRPRTSAR